MTSLASGMPEIHYLIKPTVLNLSRCTHFLITEQQVNQYKNLMLTDKAGGEIFIVSREIFIVSREN